MTAVLTNVRISDIGRSDLADVTTLELGQAAVSSARRATVRYEPAGVHRYVLVLGEAVIKTAEEAGEEWMTVLVLGDTRTLRLRFLHATAAAIRSGHLTPLEEAALYERMTLEGFTLDDIAGPCGKPTSDIQWRIDLLKLNSRGRHALSIGTLPVGLAWYIACLPRSKQTRVLRQWLAGELGTARQAEAAVRDMQNA